jgi:hypothetical protein
MVAGALVQQWLLSVSPCEVQPAKSRKKTYTEFIQTLCGIGSRVLLLGLRRLQDIVRQHPTQGFAADQVHM